MNVPEVHFAFSPGYQGKNINVFDVDKADDLVGWLIANKCLPLWLVEDDDFVDLIA